MTQPVLRLAMRVEGNKWNAYIAKGDTMDGAIWVGSIALRFVENNPQRKQAFIDLMTGAMTEVIEMFFGVKPDKWEQRPAPERDRSGEA